MTPHTNSVNLAGNLTHEPKVLSDRSTGIVAEICLAVRHSSSVVMFFDVTLKGHLAARAEFLEKGTPLHVEAHLELVFSRDLCNGGVRSHLKIVADRIRVLEPDDNGLVPEAVACTFRGDSLNDGVGTPCRVAAGIVNEQ